MFHTPQAEPEGRKLLHKHDHDEDDDEDDDEEEHHHKDKHHKDKHHAKKWMKELTEAFDDDHHEPKGPPQGGPGVYSIFISVGIISQLSRAWGIHEQGKEWQLVYGNRTSTGIFPPCLNQSFRCGGQAGCTSKEEGLLMLVLSLLQRARTRGATRPSLSS